MEASDKIKGGVIKCCCRDHIMIFWQLEHESVHIRLAVASPYFSE